MSGFTLTETGRAAGAKRDWIAVGNATNAPRRSRLPRPPYYVTQATWSSPVSSRLLVDAGLSRFHYRFAGNGQVPPDGLADLIPVTEQSSIYGLANFSYRGLYDPNAHAFADNKATSIQWRSSVAYVSGAHNFKIGYMGSSLIQTQVASPTIPSCDTRSTTGAPSALATSSPHAGTRPTTR